MSVSTNQGGSLEFIGQSEVVRHYLAISNELNSPRILVCPCETKRKRTISFDTLTRNNVSYFVGLDAVETAPQSILSGDRNITTNGQLMSGILNLSTNTLGIWTKDIHMNGGNIGLGDGSAQQVTAIQFNEQVWKSDKFPVRLEIP